MGIEPTLDLIDPTTALKTAGNTSHQSPPLECGREQPFLLPWFMLLMEHHTRCAAKCKFLLAIRYN